MNELMEKDCQIKELKQELNDVRCGMKEADNTAHEARKQYELAKEKIAELERKIKFLEGQIEAYQYCMNCKR